MDCPVCRDVKLAMTDRQGIEIDYCPQCRGVWLDRGELDKLIERAAAPAAETQAPAAARHAPPPPPAAYPGHGQAQPYPQHPQYAYGKKKKKSLLDDLFDF